MELFTRYAEIYDRNKIEEMTLQDYLLGCRDDSMMRATAAERMIAAIGEPELFQSLAGMPEKTDNPLDCLFHAVEIFKDLVALDGPI